MEGGIADYTRILAREMVRQGHEVFILTHPQAREHDDGVHVTATVAHWNKAFFRVVRQWALNHRLDMVNLQYQTAAYNMHALIHFLPLRLHPLPYVTTFHDLRFPYLFPKVGFLRPWIVNQMARLSTGVITTNRGDEKQLRERVNPRHLIQIPLGTTVEVYAAAPEGRGRLRQRMGVDDHTLVVGHFGFINASKGVDTLIDAVQIAGQQIPIKLMMIGGRTGASDPTNHAYVQSMDELAASLGVEPHWTGFVDDRAIADPFEAADVIALPFKDGASLRRTSLQAALAYGCPIVTTQPVDDDLPEFEAGKHLLYVPIDDPQALAAALIDLYQHPEKRRHLGQGAQLAAAQFHWDVIARRTLAFYEQVIGASRVK